MKSIHSGNRLISGLPRKDSRRVLSSCDEVDLSYGGVLLDQGDRIRHVYFPVDGFISQLIPVDGRMNLEVELVGNEGMLGVAVMLGVNVAPLQALVQGSGSCWRMSVRNFRREIESSPALQRELHRYIYVLMVQLSQSAACLSFHVLDARLARWLLMTHDRVRSDQFRLTHEFLAQMLGVRRVGVTTAAGLLQKRGLLSYNRGDITILDRAGLEAASCSCYQATRDVYERVLG